jgi:hypothetical protein
MQAITVKYIPPTNTRGSRWRAKCDAGSVTLAQDYAVEPSANARLVALALARKLGWRGAFFEGSLPRSNSEAYVYVCVPRGADGSTSPRAAFTVES